MTDVTRPAEPILVADGTADHLRRTQGTVLSDIRILECLGRPEAGDHHHYAGKVFAVPPSVNARAHRLAELCARDRVFLGKRSLYVCLTPALPADTVVVTDFRQEIWQQYVVAGLSATFNAQPEETRASLGWEAVKRCLRATVAAQDRSLAEAAVCAVESGDDEMRFSLRSKTVRQFHIALSYTMPTFPGPARLWLTLRERATGNVREVVLFESSLSWEAAALGGPIKLIDGFIEIRTPTSGSAAYYSRTHGIAAFEVRVESLLHDDAPSVVRRAFSPS